MIKRDAGSIPPDANPEGINQYSGGAGMKHAKNAHEAAKKASESANIQANTNHPSFGLRGNQVMASQGAKISGAAGKSGKLEDHEHAHEYHKSAAQKTAKTNPEQSHYHEQAAGHHANAARAIYKSGRF